MGVLAQAARKITVIRDSASLDIFDLGSDRFIGIETRENQYGRGFPADLRIKVRSATSGP
jgi:hypothetical protein